MRSSNEPPTVLTSCVVEGCERPVEIKTRGLCRRCYQKWRTYGDPAAGVRKMTHPDICEVEGCDLPWRTQGRCNAHYKRLRAGITDDSPVRHQHLIHRPSAHQTSRASVDRQEARSTEDRRVVDRPVVAVVERRGVRVRPDRRQAGAVDRVSTE